MIYRVSLDQIRTIGHIISHGTLVKKPEQQGENMIVDTWYNDFIFHSTEDDSTISGRTVRVDIKHEIRRDGKKRVLAKTETGETKINERKWH